MQKTIFITGASGGIGLATALLFHKKGYHIAATMRTPSPTHPLTKLDRVRIYPLDVTKTDTITQAVHQAIDTFGRIDILINNAGYGAIGPFEAATEEQIDKQLRTNVTGLMLVTQALIPHMRAKGGGTIINLSSIAGRMTFPLFSLYNASKWAVEGFSEALQYELEPFDIRVKIIEPGPIKTDFYTRSQDVLSHPSLNTYQDFQHTVIQNINKSGNSGSGPEIVAKKIFQAATDNRSRMRYTAGNEAAMLIFLRKLLPTRFFNSIVKMVVTKQ